MRTPASRARHVQRSRIGLTCAVLAAASLGGAARAQSESRPPDVVRAPAPAGKAPAPQARAAGEVPPAIGKVDRLLHELDKATAMAHEERAARLIALGEAGLPRLFEVLAAVEYLALDPDGTPHGVRLNQRLGEAIVDALEATPRPAVLALFGTLTEDSVPRAHREVALRLLGTFGTPAELPLAVALATLPTSGDGDGGAPRSLSELLERVVTAILVRDDRGCGKIGALLRGARPDLHPALVRGLGRVSTRNALVALADAFTGDAHVDTLALNQIGRLSARLPLPAPPALTKAVRTRLGSPSPSVAREAALAAGRLGDSESIAALIDLLESAHPGLVGNAHWALVTMTGLQLRPEPGRWRAWHQGELEWWREESGALFDELSDGEPELVARAINEISNRRAYRHELAEELTRALVHPDPGIQVMACGALGRFRSLNAVEPLIQLLDFTELEIREAAWEALKAITGLALPPSTSAWKEAL